MSLSLSAFWKKSVEPKLKAVFPTKRVMLARGAGFFIILMIFGPLLLESMGDILETFGVRSEKVWIPFLHGAFWYQTVVKAGSRRPRDHYVRLVTLVKTREPNDIFDNICRQRLFMGKLLKRIEAAHPAVIVIDKYFSPGSCPDPNEKGNQELFSSLDTDIPIIVGLHTADEDDLAAQKEITDTERAGLRRANLILEPAFSLPANDNIKYGLIRGNHDTRKIPLQWRVFAGRQDLETDRQPTTLPTLSKSAAEAFDSTVFDEPRLKDLLDKNRHPFTSFLSESEILTFSAIQLICGKNATALSNWEYCKPERFGDDLLRNHVVVIGNRTKDDFSPSVVGTVPGVVLQANYIESLLDERYFSPVNLALAIAINLFVVFVIIALFSKSILTATLSPDVALVGSLTVILLGWIVIYLVALHFGYYMVIWFPGVLALFAIWAHMRAHSTTGPAHSTKNSGGQHV